MKASELRIGNYLNDSINGIVQIEMFYGTESFQMRSIDPDEDVTIPLDSCKYIPLTEYWLIKFGFKTRIGKFGREVYWISLNNFHVDLHMDKSLGAGYYFMLNDIQYSKPLEFVHELQNLVFALTGEELILKQ